MDKVLYISSENNLKYWNPEYHRIYFGNEFCQRLIPSISQLSNVINFSQKNNVRLSITTPYLTDDGLTKLDRLFKFLNKNNFCLEIIANDWGTIRKINQEYINLTPVLGRLLVKIKREPRLCHVKNIISPYAWKQFQTPEPASSMFNALLKKNNIKRVEFDNVYQGIHFSGQDTGLSASIYYPYIYLTTSRYCLASTCEKPGTMIGIFPCNYECRKYTFLLHNKGMEREITLKGNTQFLYNEKLPDNLMELGINRIVFQPEIPM